MGGEVWTGPERAWTGRMVLSITHDVDFFLDGTASRFTPQSIAGLVVGAMGVFVFAVVLRRWLKNRRAFREAG